MATIRRLDPFLLDDPLRACGTLAQLAHRTAKALRHLLAAREPAAAEVVAGAEASTAREAFERRRQIAVGHLHALAGALGAAGRRDEARVAAAMRTGVRNGYAAVGWVEWVVALDVTADGGGPVVAQ